MKKISILLVALMMVATSFAQVLNPKNVMNSKQKEVLNKKPIYENTLRDASFGALNYAIYLYTNVGYQPTSNDYTFNYLQTDSIGGVYRNDTLFMHPWIHGLGMTYDFTHTLYENLAAEGEVSLAYSPVLKLDSIYISGAYLRSGCEIAKNIPTDACDTLIVGVLTTLTDDDIMGGGYYDDDHVFHANFRFHDITFNYNTLMQEGATLYKFPLSTSDASWDSAGYFRFSTFALPINQGNITNKILNVAYTFKRGNYALGVDDNLDNYSNFFARCWTDYRMAYYPYYNYETTHQADWQTCSEDFVNNHNKGYYIDDDTRYDLTEQGHVGYRQYTPTFYLSSMHYPDIDLVLSCTDCAYTNVEDMEKENITVYPNPATNVLNVKLAGDKEANVQMFNLVGQQVYNSTATNTASINVSNMKAGVYMLKVSQNGKVYTSKVVVK
jgi:hypothetical protein